jgi:hypothetical protein
MYGLPSKLVSKQVIVHEMYAFSVNYKLMFLIQAPWINPIKYIWSKFTYSFRKLHHFIVMSKLLYKKEMV